MPAPHRDGKGPREFHVIVDGRRGAGEQYDVDFESRATQLLDGVGPPHGRRRVHRGVGVRAPEMSLPPVPYAHLADPVPDHADRIVVAYGVLQLLHTRLARSHTSEAMCPFPSYEQTESTMGIGFTCPIRCNISMLW